MGGGISKMAKQNPGRVHGDNPPSLQACQRLLSQLADKERNQVMGRRIYDEAVRDAVIVWSGKPLTASAASGYRRRCPTS